MTYVWCTVLHCMMSWKVYFIEQYTSAQWNCNSYCHLPYDTPYLVARELFVLAYLNVLSNITNSNHGHGIHVQYRFSTICVFLGV